MSREGWAEWLQRLQMIINENQLSTADPEAIALIEQHMVGFLFGEGNLGGTPGRISHRPREEIARRQPATSTASEGAMTTRIASRARRSEASTPAGGLAEREDEAEVGTPFREGKRPHTPREP